MTRTRTPPYKGHEFAGWNERDQPLYWSCDRAGNKELFTRSQIDYGERLNAQQEAQQPKSIKSSPQPSGQSSSRTAPTGQYVSEIRRPMASPQYKPVKQMTPEEYAADEASSKRAREASRGISPAGSVRQDRGGQTPTQGQYRELSAKEVEWYRVRDAAIREQADGVTRTVNGHVLTPEEIANLAIPVAKDSVFSRR